LRRTEVAARKLSLAKSAHSKEPGVSIGNGICDSDKTGLIVAIGAGQSVRTDTQDEYRQNHYDH
jgi:hypothetical protein